MVEAGESIARELEQALDVLRAAGAQTRDYGETLHAVIADDAAVLDPAGFKTLVRRLVTATAEMATQNQALQARMTHSAEQVQALKTALHAVKREALTDRLTGLANRRLFDETLAARLAADRQTGGALALLLCDIDHFKRVNDTWGHVVGDQVIRCVASVVQALAPAEALAARYGGEEFALIVPEAALPVARAIGEAMRSGAAAKQLSRRATGEKLGVRTISIGVA
jgi:diguanylate cyclase